MPLRTIHAILADGELATEDYAITITPVLADGKRIGVFNPADAEATPLNPDYAATGATYLPRPYVVPIVSGMATFELLESADPEPNVLYRFRIQGSMVDPVVVTGVRCPSISEHPDPLYLWQLIQDYADAA